MKVTFVLCYFVDYFVLMWISIFYNCISGCNCSVNGTIAGQTTCDQITGQCECKSTIFGTNCDKCKLGYFKFPQNIDDKCKPCNCDLGGSVDLFCNQNNGKYFVFFLTLFKRSFYIQKKFWSTIPLILSIILLLYFIFFDNYYFNWMIFFIIYF